MVLKMNGIRGKKNSPLYHDFRRQSFCKVSDVAVNLFAMSGKERLNYLFKYKPFYLAQLLLCSWVRLGETLFV